MNRINGANSARHFLVAALVSTSLLTPVAALARGGGGRGGGGYGSRPANVQSARNNVSSHNTNYNRNTNVNVNRNVNVHGGYGGYRGGYGYNGWGHPIAGVATVAASALVVGAVVASLPSSGCSAVSVGGIGYQRCGSTYYQPAYQGGTVNYTVVNPPAGAPPPPPPM